MKRLVASVVTFSLFASLSFASSQPVRCRNGMVVSQKMLASEAGLGVLRDGGSAVDAAVATALALAVTLPRAELLFARHSRDTTSEGPCVPDRGNPRLRANHSLRPRGRCLSRRLRLETP